MTSSCPKCSLPLNSATGVCNFCGSNATQGLPSRQTPSTFSPSLASYKTRAVKHDLVSHLLDIFLMMVTIGIGGLVWSAILAFSSQTPANKIRDEVVINVRNSKSAPAWKLIIRAFLMFFFLLYFVLGVLSGFASIIDIGGYYVATFWIPGTLALLALLDLLLPFTPVRRRLIDWLLAIKIVDGNGYSFRNYKSPERG